MKRLPFFPLALILCLFACDLFAQTIFYTQYTTSSGLPSNTVYYVMQDHDGFLWFGTDAGVSRYDGRTFTTYTPQNNLSDNEIFRLIEDSHKRMWCLPFNGKIAYYYNGAFYNSSNDSTLKGIEARDIYSGFLEDSHGNIWVSSISKGVYVLHQDGTSQYFEYKKKSPIDDFRYSIHYLWEDNGHVYGLSGDGIITFNHDTPHKHTYHQIANMHVASDAGRKISVDTVENKIMYPRADGNVLEVDYKNFSFKIIPSDVAVFGMYAVNRDSMWVYHSAGAFMWNSHSGEMKETQRYFNGATVSHVLQDKDGGYWFTTLNQGVFYMPSLFVQRISFDQLQSNPIRRVHLKDDNTMIAARENGAYALLSIKDFNVKHFPSPVQIDNVRIDQIQSEGDTVWMNGKASGLIKLWGKHTEVIYARATIKTLSLNGNQVIMETGFAGLKEFTRSEIRIHPERNFFNYRYGRITQRTYSLCTTQSNKVLTGTINGLIAMEGDVVNNLAHLHPYLMHRIVQIVEDHEGYIWALADATSVVVLDKDLKLIGVLDESSGIGKDAAIRMFVDNQETVWIISRHRVYKASVQKNKLQLHSFFASEREDFHDVTANNHSVYLATSEGIIILPRAFEQQDQIKARLSEVQVNGMKIDFTSGDKDLPFNQNSLRVYFGAPSFTTKEIFFRYKIHDRDSVWTITTANELEFSSLPPGNYHFQLQAKNANGDWSKHTASFKIHIQKPIWYEWWFVMILIVLLMGLTAWIIQGAYQANYRKVMLHDRLVESELKALVAQMNPHFIFNTLNTIQKFFITSDTKTANRLLSRFSKLMRMILDNTSKSFITVEDEIAFLNHYLEIERMRFNQQFDFSITTDAALDITNAMIPSMTIQPFVENAILHGVMPIKSGGMITIHFSRENAFTKVIVEDNGVGRTENQNRTHEPRGINLIRERLSILSTKNKKDYKLDIIDLTPPDKGTRIELYL